MEACENKKHMEVNFQTFLSGIQTLKTSRLPGFMLLIGFNAFKGESSWSVEHPSIAVFKHQSLHSIFTIHLLSCSNFLRWAFHPMIERVHHSNGSGKAKELLENFQVLFISKGW